MFDCTANHGGDTIAMALHPEFNVYATENDTPTYNNLVHNVDQYIATGEISGENVHLYNENCLKLLDDGWEFDLIYIDPPFGTEYRTQDRYIPRLNGIRLDSVVNNYIAQAAIFMLKVPKNFDIKTFRRNTIGYIEFHELRNHKMSLVIIETGLDLT